MILPDVNLLVYAYNSEATLHKEAVLWWEDLLNGTESVAIPWAVSCGFVRIMTHPRVLETPMKPEAATDVVRSWFDVPVVSAVSPGRRHLDLLRTLFMSLGVGGNLVTDAHLAAIAIELQAELHSNDTDFSRFPGLNWRNPLDGKR